MEMYCWSDLKTGLLGSMYYPGKAFASILLFFLSLRLGRRPILILGNLYTLATMSLVIFFPQTWTRFVGIFLIGIADFR